MSPTVAVVIATRDRPRLLDRCLTALAGQRRPADEVVVVDDGSIDPATGEVLESNTGHLPLRVLRSPRPQGPGRARQLGWRAAGADVVAFTDDDCRPDPGWLAGLCTASGPRCVVVGRTLPDPLDGPIGSVLDRTMRIEAHDGRFSTCNVAYPRALLEELGGFDPAFDLYGEDTDLGQRARAAGAEDRWEPAAVVWHAVHRVRPWSAVVERRRVGEIARLVRRHPHLRTEIWEGVFWKRQHREFLQLAAGVALARRTPAGLLLAMPWMRTAAHRLRLTVPESASRGRLWQSGQVAALAAVDAVEIASCAMGSARHRTLFL